MVKLKYEGVVVRADHSEGLVMASVSGDVTETSAGRIIGDARKWAPEPLAQVVSYKAARVAICAESLFRVAQAAHPADTPTALVVPVDQFEMFRVYVRMHIERGLHKAVFTSEADARQWAGRQAGVREYWRRLERSRRSSP